MLAAAAAALGLTVDELQQRLAGGTRMAAIAAERGVDLASLRAAMRSAHHGGMAGMMHGASGSGPGGMDTCPFTPH